MVARLVALADQCPPGARFMLLAFDFTFDEEGTKREDLTTFSVPNAYAQRIAQSRSDRFEWIASIHPSRLVHLGGSSRCARGTDACSTAPTTRCRA